MGDELTGYDLVIALSEDAINQQLLSLWEQGVIERQWEFGIDAQGGTLSISAQLGTPRVVLPAGRYNDVILVLALNHGKLTFGNHFATISNWTFAFQADMKLVPTPIETLRRGRAPAQAIKALQHEVDLDRLLDISALFVDFENANFANYDKSLSHFDLSSGNLSEVMNVSVATIQFTTLLSSHFRALAGSSNPYVLGYAVRRSAPGPTNAGGPPTYVPTYASFSTFPDMNGRASLNFLFMTNGRPGPNMNRAGIFNRPWIDSLGQYGVYAVSERLFMNDLLEHLAALFGFHAGDFSPASHYLDQYAKFFQNPIFSAYLKKLGYTPESLIEHTFGGAVGLFYLSRHVSSGRLSGGTITIGVGCTGGTAIRVRYQYTVSRENKILGFISAGSTTATAEWTSTYDYSIQPDGRMTATVSTSPVARSSSTSSEWWGDLIQGLLTPTGPLSELIYHINSLRDFPNVVGNQWTVAKNQLGVVLPAGGSIHFGGARFDENGDLLVRLEKPT